MSSRLHHNSILAVLKIGLVAFAWYPTSTILQCSMYESIAPKHHVQYCFGRLLARGQLFSVVRSWMGWWGHAKRIELQILPCQSNIQDGREPNRFTVNRNRLNRNRCEPEPV